MALHAVYIKLVSFEIKRMCYSFAFACANTKQVRRKPEQSVLSHDLSSETRLVIHYLPNFIKGGHSVDCAGDTRI